MSDPSLEYVGQHLEKKGYYLLPTLYNLTDKDETIIGKNLRPAFKVSYAHESFVKVIHVSGTTIGIDRYMNDSIYEPLIPIAVVDLCHPDSFACIDSVIDNYWKRYKKSEGFGIKWRIFAAFPYAAMSNTLFGKVFRRVYIYSLVLLQTLNISNMIAEWIAG